MLGTTEAPKVPRPILVAFGKGRLRVGLSDGREISVPLSWFPRLAKATASERSKWRVIGEIVVQ